MAREIMPNGNIRVYVDVGRKINGARDRRTKVCHSKEEADRAEAEFEAIRSCNIDENNGRSSSITFREYVYEVFWPIKKNLRDTTKQGYERDIRRAMPYLGSMQMSEIGSEHIQALINECSTRKVATNLRETLSSVFRLAMQTKGLMLPRNPASAMFTYPETLAVRDSRDGVVLTSFSAQIELLERVRDIAPGSAIERMFLLGMPEGMRKGEIFGLDGPCLDMAAREIDVCQTYTTGKGGAHLTPPKNPNAVRRFPMVKYVFERVQDIGIEDEGPWIKNGCGRRYNPTTAKKHLAEFVAEHDLPRVTLASMRHSFGTSAIRAGMPVKVVSKWMGHSNVSVTLNRYVRPNITDMHADTALIDSAFGL